jgi:type III pantothenate kinase
MKLIIDIGNTLQKAAIFDENTLIKLCIYKKISVAKLKEIFLSFKIDRCILSSVINYNVEISEFLISQCTFLELNHKTSLPITNKYNSPETLGKDRLSAAVASQIFFTGENIVIIDIGTAIKYDFINSNAEYLGGAISPGINLRFKSLHNYTGKLPLVSYQDINFITGQNTNQSLLSGVINGITYEIDGFIDYYKNRIPNLKIILSGGDYKYFEKRLKNAIFAVPNIVLLGLNKILDHNAIK